MQECDAFSIRSLYSSQSWTRFVKSAPTSSQRGRPAANSSSITHWRNGSATTGHASSMPQASRSQSRSLSLVTGVIRSTIELGNVQFASTHSARPPPRRSHAAIVAARATVPFPGRLSQLRTVSGPAFAPRRSSRPRATTSSVAFGASREYPPSVIVSEKIPMSGFEIWRAPAAPSPGAKA